MEKKQFITTCYRSPDDENTAFYSKFKQIIDNVGNKNSIVCGDFNYNLLNCNQHKETNMYFNHMIAIGFLPTITKPTRITNLTATLIDHIWCNSMEMFYSNSLNSSIIIYDISDHLPTTLTFYTKNMK